MNAKMTEQFTLRANSPAQWRGSAQSLKDCAELVFGAHLAALQAVMGGDIGQHVFSHLRTGGVFFLLAGLAVENLVKALVIHRGGATVATRLPRALKTHGIRALLERLEISLSPEEDKLVSRLETAIAWAGRYPVPLDAGQLRGAGIITRVTDAQEFSAFYGRLDALLDPTTPSDDVEADR